MFDNDEEYEEGQIVMPVMMVIDHSTSMEPVIGQLDTWFKELSIQLSTNPVLRDVVRVGAIQFDQSAEVLFPLGEMGPDTTVPALRAGGGTMYGPAFELIAKTLREYHQAVRGRGLKIFRPMVLFLTDGEPVHDPQWLQTFRDTLTYDAATGTGNKLYPTFVALGFGSANEDVLSELAYPAGTPWYRATSTDPEMAVEALTDFMLRSVIESGLSSTTAQPRLGPAAAAGAGVEAMWPDE